MTGPNEKLSSTPTPTADRCADQTNLAREGATCCTTKAVARRVEQVANCAFFISHRLFPRLSGPKPMAIKRFGVSFVPGRGHARREVR